MFGFIGRRLLLAIRGSGVELIKRVFAGGLGVAIARVVVSFLDVCHQCIFGATGSLPHRRSETLFCGGWAFGGFDGSRRRTFLMHHGFDEGDEECLHAVVGSNSVLFGNVGGFERVTFGFSGNFFCLLFSLLDGKLGICCSLSSDTGLFFKHISNDGSHITDSSADVGRRQGLAGGVNGLGGSSNRGGGVVGSYGRVVFGNGGCGGFGLAFLVRKSREFRGLVKDHTRGDFLRPGGGYHGERFATVGFSLGEEVD